MCTYMYLFVAHGAISKEGQDLKAGCGERVVLTYDETGEGGLLRVRKGTSLGGSGSMET